MAQKTSKKRGFPCLQMIFFAIALGIGIGTNSLISRKLGEGNHSEASNAALTGLFLGACAILVAIICSFFLPKIFFVKDRFENPYNLKPSENVADCFMKFMAVNRGDVKNFADQALMILAWIFDLNYKYSFVYLEKLKIIDKIFDNFSKFFEKEDANMYKSLIKKYVQDKIKHLQQIHTTPTPGGLTIIIIATLMLLFIGFYIINKANNSGYIELEKKDIIYYFSLVSIICVIAYVANNIFVMTDGGTIGYDLDNAIRAA